MPVYSPWSRFFQGTSLGIHAKTTMSQCERKEGVRLGGTLCRREKKKGFSCVRLACLALCNLLVPPMGHHGLRPRWVAATVGGGHDMARSRNWDGSADATSKPAQWGILPRPMRAASPALCVTLALRPP